jgi:ferredoxin
MPGGRALDILTPAVGILVDGALCTNGRRCEAACPTGALRGG